MTVVCVFYALLVLSRRCSMIVVRSAFLKLVVERGTVYERVEGMDISKKNISDGYYFTGNA